MLEKLKRGLIVSCYASASDGDGGNKEMANPVVMSHIAHAVELGGAKGIRTNIDNIREIKKKCKLPVIGIKKITKAEGGFETGDFRITPTLKEVKALVGEGADLIAIDGTNRARYDDLTLEEFIKRIKRDYNIPIIADISTYEEGIKAHNAGADAVGTTLSGYTPYSENPIVFGVLPLPDPDFGLIQRLSSRGIKVIAEGRIGTPKQAKKALDSGAFAVVVGTAITMPRRVAESFVMEMTGSN